MPATPTWVPSLRLSLDDASWQRVVDACGGDAAILWTPADLFPSAPLDPFAPGAQSFLFQYEGDFYAACRSFGLDLRPGALYLGITTSAVRARLAGPGPITYLSLPDLSQSRLTALVATLNAIVPRSLMQVLPSTLALWQLGGADPDVARDETGRFNLRGSGAVAPALVLGTGLARQFVSTDVLATSNQYNPPATTALIGEWTVECWARLGNGSWPPVPSTYANIVIVDFTENVLLYVGVTPALRLTAFWEYGGGPTGVSATDSTTLALDTRYHLAVRKRAIGGSLFDVDFFVDGVFSSTVASLHNADGGATDDWGIGEDFAGVLQSVRVSGATLSDATILADYQMGA